MSYMRISNRTRKSPQDAQGEKTQIKIFYIGGFSKSYDSEVYIAHGFRELGVDIKCWDESLNLPLDMLLERIEMFNPDFVLLSKNKKYGKPLIERLRGKYLTVSWLFDLYHDLPREMGCQRSVKDSPFYADRVFMSDGGEVGIQKETIRQGIHEPEAVLGKANVDHDVVFIGSDTYFGRHKMIEFLKETYGDRFAHYGMGGKPEVRGLELNNLLAGSKVVVGDSVHSPNYWSNRIYEVIGRGGFLLHPKVEGLDEEFEPYKHYIPFERGNFEQIKEIVDYYISHDKEREKIRLAGFDFCKTNYKYQDRCLTLLQKVIGTKEQ